MSEKIRKYIGFQFNNGQITNSRDYVKFERLCKEILREETRRIGAKVVGFETDSYFWSAIVEKDEKFVLVTIPNVRAVTNGWVNEVKMRLVKNKNDYSGSFPYRNNANIFELGRGLERMFNGENKRD